MLVSCLLSVPTSRENELTTQLPERGAPKWRKSPGWVWACLLLPGLHVPLGVNPRLCLRCLLEDKGDPQVGNHSQTRRAARTAGHSLPGLGLSPARRGLGRAHLAVLHAGAGAALRPLRTSPPVPGCEGHRAWTACCGLTGQRPRAGSPGGSESSRAVFWSASLRAPRSLCWSAVLPGGQWRESCTKLGGRRGTAFRFAQPPPLRQRL